MIAIALVLALFEVGAGAWAFLAPHPFAEVVATFAPFNAHFLHDAGAFQLGLGAALLVALARRRGLVVAFAANLVADAVHVVAHVEDSRLGGHPYDVPLLTLIALLAAAGLVLAIRAERARDAIKREVHK